MRETIDPGQQALDREMEEIRRELGDDFVSLSSDSARVRLHTPGLIGMEAGNVHHELSILRRLMAGEIEEAVFNPDMVRILTREKIHSLQVEGLVLDGISKEHPHGGIHIGDLAPSFLSIARDFGAVDREKLEALEAIRATNVLRGVTGLITRPPVTKIPDDLGGLPRFPVHSLCAAVYKDGEWSETHVFPDGRWFVEGFDNTAFQYGQSAFEGIAAVDGESNIFESGIDASIHNGKIHIFRPEENAMRLIRSCLHFSMPPISVSQFVEAVRQAVLNNRNFLPKGGKLYIRAFVVGLGGGTGANRAKKYLFGVEASPYGQYFGGESAEDSDTLPGIKVKTVTCDRPTSGKCKVASNYAPIFAEKARAKDEGYGDIMLISQDGHVLENGTSNIFFVENDGEGGFIVSTPTLEENILPGITRKSLITLVRDPKIQGMLGCRIRVMDHTEIYETHIGGRDGAFTTGTAATISNIEQVDYRYDGDSVVSRRTKKFTDRETQLFIKRLYDLLMKARHGQLPGYESWAVQCE